MFSSKLTGLFKKFLRQPDDDSLLDSTSTLTNTSERGLSINCGSSDSRPTGDLNCNIKNQRGMGGYSICGGTGCLQRFEGSGCAHCLAVLSSESAAYPDDSTDSTIISSSLTDSTELSGFSQFSGTSRPTGASELPDLSAEPLCCCESCSWWLDSYPHINRPSTAKSLPSIAPKSIRVSSSTQRHNSISTTSTREQTERRKLRKCDTASSNNTSILSNSINCRLGEGDSQRQGLNEDQCRFPISVTMSADDEEGYAMSQQRLFISNRLRHHVTSHNFEAGRSSMQAPPNKSICHVIR